MNPQDRQRGANKNKATERKGRFERLNSACCLFVCKEANKNKATERSGRF
jgi:hypothetical protein